MRKWLFLSLTSLLVACSSEYEQEDIGANSGHPDGRKNRGLGKFFGDSSITVGGSKKASDEETGLGVNSYLWRASLDTVSFMPIVSADPFGGVILTDWFSPHGSPTERFKVNVYVLSRQLTSDGIRVAVFRQELKNGQWMDSPTDTQTQRKMENTILSHARDYRSKAK